MKWEGVRTGVGVYRRAAECTLEDADGSQDEPRPDFGERHLWRPVWLQRVLLDDLPECTEWLREVHSTFALHAHTRTWKLRNQILLSRMEKVRTWSTKGFAFRACGGTPNICGHAGSHNWTETEVVEAGLTCVNTSFVSFPHSLPSKALSKLRIPLLPFRQLPVILSSSMVWTFCTCILMLGPFGVFAAHR